MDHPWPKPYTEQFAEGNVYSIRQNPHSASAHMLTKSLELISFLLAEGTGGEPWWSYGKQLVDIGAEAGLIEPFPPPEGGDAD